MRHENTYLEENLINTNHTQKYDTLSLLDMNARINLNIRNNFVIINFSNKKLMSFPDLEFNTEINL